MADRRRHGLIRFILGVAVPVLVSVPLIAGFLGGWHPAFDSLAHFRAHFAVLLALAALVAFAAGGWGQAAAAILLSLTALSTTAVDLKLPLAGGAVAGPAEPGAARYRLMQLNLFFANPSPELALSQIARFGPDVVTLNEVSATWRPKLDLLASAYPHRVVCTGGGRIGGSAILSRRPFTEMAPQCLENGRVAVANIDLGGRTLTVAAIHLHWPWPSSQHAQVARLAPLFAALGPSAIISGDFNAAGWSTTARRIAAYAGMQPILAVGPTWQPGELPLWLRPVIGLPIDHVLTGPDVRVLAATTGDHAGSDHLPILVEFALPQPAQEIEDESATAMAVLESGTGF